MPSFLITFFSNTLPTLFGVVVGGLITYLTTHTIETQKWKQQKKDKYLEDRREALKLVLEWIDPIDRAISRAITLANPFRMRLTNENYRGAEINWPDLATEIAKMDLRPASRFLLPEKIYGEAYTIIHAIDEIGFRNEELIQTWEIAVAERIKQTKKRQPLNMNPIPRRGEIDDEYRTRIREMQNIILDKIDDLRDMKDNYRKQLREEYDATYK